VSRGWRERVLFERAMSERQCDFAEALAAMHELVGSKVGVCVLGAWSRSSEPTLAFTGRVERGLELGSRKEDAVGFDIGGVLLCLSARTLETAWRCEYPGAGGRWLAVGLRFRGGVEVEVDQLPDREALERLQPPHDD
jgi:hypothetical protein